MSEGGGGWGGNEIHRFPSCKVQSEILHADTEHINNTVELLGFLVDLGVTVIVNIINQ